MKDPLILGSKSPRRKQILDFFDISFIQVAPEFDETLVDYRGNPRAFVHLIARKKATSVCIKYPQRTVLAADTVVLSDQKLFGKPQNHREAEAMLRELSGRRHSVFTGLLIRHNGREYFSYEETRVFLNELNLEQIRLYLSKFPFLDKAGAYGIQMGAGLIVKKIEGCFYNVMGLPINALKRLFHNIGIDLWRHIRNRE